MSDIGPKRQVVDDMIRDRMESSGENLVEAIESIMALVANLPDDAPVSVKHGGTTVEPRTIREWSYFSSTPQTSGKSR